MVLQRRIGHSLVGDTVMAMAGARFNKVRHDRYCDTHLDRGDCHWAGTVGLGEDPRSVARLERSLEDPRLTAAVSFDLGFTQAFNPASVTAIDIPILVIGAGRHLPNLPVADESRHLAKMLPAAAVAYREIEDISHFTFFAECKPGAVEPVAVAGEGDEIICDDGGGRGRAALHAEIGDLVKTFLGEAGVGPSGGS